jgi:ABC-type thiamin/hydroxymethylpyrimidine transport system permease subunit
MCVFTPVVGSSVDFKNKLNIYIYVCDTNIVFLISIYRRRNLYSLMIKHITAGLNCQVTEPFEVYINFTQEFSL